MSYTTKRADGTGHLQKGWYAHNESPDSMEAIDRWVGPWRTERGAAAAIAKAEAKYTTGADIDDELCRLAREAGKTTSMQRERAIHDRVRDYMD